MLVYSPGLLSVLPQRLRPSALGCKSACILKEVKSVDHPYALELFSHVSPAGMPTAICCQRNYVTVFHNLTGPKDKASSSFLDFFLELLLLMSLEGSSRVEACRWFFIKKQPFVLNSTYMLYIQSLCWCYMKLFIACRSFMWHLSDYCDG